VQVQQNDFGAVDDHASLTGAFRLKKRRRAPGCRSKYCAIGGATGGLNATFSLDAHSNGGFHHAAWPRYRFNPFTRDRAVRCGVDHYAGCTCSRAARNEEPLAGLEAHDVVLRFGLIEVYPCAHMTYFDSRRSMANATPCQPSSSRLKDWFIVSRNSSRRQAGCLFCSHQAQ